MSYSAKVNCSVTSRFLRDDDKTKSITKTFDNLSIGFITGFQSIQDMITDDGRLIVAEISDHIIRYPSVYVNLGGFEGMISNGLSHVCRNGRMDFYKRFNYFPGGQQNNKIDDDSLGSYFKSICERDNIKIDKRYSAIISSCDIGFAIIQFDSLDYLSAIQTYSSWACSWDCQIDIECFFDNFVNTQFKTSYRFSFLSAHIEKYR